MKIKFNSWVVLFIIAIIICSSSCRKTDFVKDENGNSINSIEEKFFNTHRSNDPIEQKLVDYIKRYNNKLHFVEQTTKQIGYPRWDKATIFKNEATSFTNSLDNSSTIYYIPFVRDSQNYVNASMSIVVNATDTTFSYLLDWQYKTLPNTPTSVNDDAEKLAILLMRLDKNVFGYNKFYITDSSLFRQGNIKAKFITLDSSVNNGTSNSFTGNCTITVITYQFLCGQNIVTNNSSFLDPYCYSNVTSTYCDFPITGGLIVGGPPQGGNTSGGTSSGPTSGGSGPTGGGGGTIGSGNSTGGWAPAHINPTIAYVVSTLGLDVEEWAWLNNHLDETQKIYDFLEESRNIDPILPSNPVGYTPEQAINVAKAIIELGSNYSLNNYTQLEYNAIKQYFPLINGTEAEQANIFWSNFSIHAAISKELNPGINNFQHYLYALNKIYDCNLSQNLTGSTSANLNTNFLQTINGLGLAAVFNNQSAITPTTNLAPIEFKRKEITNPQGKKIAIVWYKDNVSGKITFGDRGQMRDILCIPKGDPRIAHHIIPVGVCLGTTTQSEHPAIKLLGSKGDFHMNQPENGIPNNNSGPHGTYDDKVRIRLDNLMLAYNSSGQTPAAYNTLKNGVFALLSQIRVLLTNPATHPNNINF